MHKIGMVHNDFKNHFRDPYIRKKPHRYPFNPRDNAWWRHGYYEAQRLERDFRNGKYPDIPRIYNDHGGLNMDYFHRYNPEDDLF